MSSDLNTKLIAVLGASGSGKSKFIEVISGGRPSHSYKTSQVTPRQFELQGSLITAFDTPGFDGERHPLTNILTMLSTELSSRYGSNRKLDGIVWFHRMSDYSRTVFPSSSHIAAFKSLLGTQSLSGAEGKFTIVTNMWGGNRRLQEAREATLRANREMLKPLLDEGAKLIRHDGTVPSAQLILKPFAGPPPPPMTASPKMSPEFFLRSPMRRRDSMMSIGSNESIGVTNTKSRRQDTMDSLKETKETLEKVQSELEKEREKANILAHNLRIESESKAIFQALLAQTEATNNAALQDARRQLEQSEISKKGLEGELKDMSERLSAERDRMGELEKEVKLEGEAKVLLQSLVSQMEDTHAQALQQAQRELEESVSKLERVVSDLEAKVEEERERNEQLCGDLRIESEAKAAYQGLLSQSESSHQATLQQLMEVTASRAELERVVSELKEQLDKEAEAREAQKKKSEEDEAKYEEAIKGLHERLEQQLSSIPAPRSPVDDSDSLDTIFNQLVPQLPSEEFKSSDNIRRTVSGKMDKDSTPVSSNSSSQWDLLSEKGDMIPMTMNRSHSHTQRAPNPTTTRWVGWSLGECWAWMQNVVRGYY